MMNMLHKINNSSTSFSLSPEMVKRLCSGVLIVGCLSLVVWSITFRLSLVTEAQSQIHTPFSLSRQVASLEQMWSDQEADSVKQEWAAMKSGSFANYDQLVEWVTQMIREAHALGLEVSYRIDEKSTPVPSVPEVHRIAMELTIQAEDPAQGYRHFMEFVKRLSENTVKVNFEALELTGTGQGAQKMELRIHSFLQQTT